MQLESKKSLTKKYGLVTLYMEVMVCLMKLLGRNLSVTRGHYLELKIKLYQLQWYVEEEIKKFDEKMPFNVVKENYASLLKNSIELRFRADVSVGFNISGGLDSSTLLAFVNQMEGKENINAYTFYCGHKDYDELFWVKEMINATQNPLNKVLLTVDHFTKEIDFLTHIQESRVEEFLLLHIQRYSRKQERMKL